MRVRGPAALLDSAGAPYKPTAAHAQGDNCLTSTIPASWLCTGSFPELWQLGLALNQLVGTIPAPQPYSGLYRHDVSAALCRPPADYHGAPCTMPTAGPCAAHVNSKDQYVVGCENQIMASVASAYHMQTLH